MGFKFGYFLSGLTTNLDETIEAATKSNVEAVAGRVKSAAETFIEQQKQFQKTREELKSTVNTAAAIKWSDGTFDDQQLIALASNPDAAKAVLEAVKKDPSITSRVSKNFVKALDTVPTNVTPQEYVDSLFKRTKATEQDIKKMFGPEEGFFGRLSSQKNMLAATKTAAKYGVSLEDLFGTQTTSAKSLQRTVEINLGELTKKPEFKDLMDSAKIDLVNAQKSGDPVKIKEASENVQRFALVDDASKLVNKSEAQIQTELVTDIVTAKKNGEDQKASDLEAILKQRQALKAGESPEKVSQSNLITIATKNLTTTVQSKLPPGSYITSVSSDGTVRTELKDLKQQKPYLEAIKESNDYIVKEFTDEKGFPKSELHKNALISRGIPFDKDGKPYSPQLPALDALKGQEAATPAPARRTGQTPSAAPASAPMAPTGEVATPPMASSAAPQQRPAAGSAREMRGTVGGGTQINTNTPEWNKFKEDLAASGLPPEAQQQVINDAVKAGVTAPRWTGRTQQQAKPASSSVLKWNPQTKKWE